MKYFNVRDFAKVLQKCREENLGDKALRKLIKKLPVYDSPEQAQKAKQ